MKRDADPGKLLAAGRGGNLQNRHVGFGVVAPVMVAVLAWGVAWYWATAREIAGIWWRSDTYAHGLVVLPIFAWLAWRAHPRMSGLQPQPVAWLALPIFGAGLLWLMGRLVGVAGAAHFGFVAMMVCSLVGVLGWRLSRILLFPLAFLMFSVPIGDFLLPTLMDFTATFTVRALRFSGVPVYREGFYFVVPNGSWSVVEACSGIRYLIASVTVGAIYAYVTFFSLRRRLLFMAAALLVPIVANWLRAYMIVMLGYLTDNRLAAGVDHLIYGWGFFGIVVFSMFWVAGRWRETVPQRIAPEVAAPAASGARWIGAVPIMAAIAAFPLVESALDRPAADYPVTLRLPAPAPSWAAEADTRLSYRPRYAGARAETFSAYRAPDGQPVGVYVAWYADQRDGREMVAWGNGVGGAGHGDARVIAEAEREASIGRVRAADVLTPKGRLRVWRWYRVNGELLTGDIDAKLRLALDRVAGRADDSAVVVLATPLTDAPADADRRLDEFLQLHAAGLEAALAAATQATQAAR